MGQRGALCMHQLFGLNPEQSDSCFRHDQNMLTGNTHDYATRNNHLTLMGPGNNVDIFNQFRDYQDRVMMYGNQYSNIQNKYSFQNHGLGPVGRNFPVHQSNVMAEPLPAAVSQTDNQINVDEFGSHNLLVDNSTGLCKRKDSEPNPNSFYNRNVAATLSSSSSHPSFHCAMPQWGQPYESVPCVMNPTSFLPSDYGARASLPVAEGSLRNIRNRTVSGILPPESVLPPQNCILSGSYMSYPFQTASNAWASQFGNGNIGDGGFNWNYNNTLQSLQGRILNTGPFLHSNVNMHASTGNLQCTNSAMHFHPSSILNVHPAVHNAQINGYVHPVHIPASYQHSVNNLYPINSNISGDGIDAGSTNPHFSTGVDQIYRPRHLLQPSQQLINGSLRLLSTEDTAIMELPGFYRVRNAADQLDDMRLDIDDMSYEELLALEEQIGVVKTGLTEEFIIKHLKLKTHVSQGTALSLDPSFRLSSMENEACSICQVEYEEDEILGTLNCGHAYHSDCIKQWLLIKNLCPICKTAALASKDRR